MSDAKAIETEVLAAVSYFKHHRYINGVKNVGEILEGIEKDISDCKSMKTDWSRITAWSAIFKQPKKLAEKVVGNAVHNWKPMEEDIKQLKTDESSANFNDMGLMVAAISVEALGPVPGAAAVMLY